MNNIRIYNYLVLLILVVGLQSCFTGVEGSPRITYSDVKKEKIVLTPEQKFLSDIAPQPPKDWAQGKKFYVTDDKISIIFTSSSTGQINNLAGQELAFHSMQPVNSVTGEEVTEIELISPSGGRLYYRDNLPFADIEQRQSLEIPFTIEESLVDAVRKELNGNTYYAVTPLWYTADGSQAVNGLRHVPVEITEVLPGNSVYPIRVVFRPVDSEKYYSMYMTVGDNRTSTRNFYTLFAFDNPRKKYPAITDDTWQMIVHSRIKQGMTRDECRLALGSPQTIGQRPTSAGMVEYWSYTDGIYLLFEDGYLSYFRR